MDCPEKEEDKVMRIALSPEEKKLLESDHRKTRDRRAADRIKAVLLSSEGWSMDQISQALRIHLETVRTHLQEYASIGKLNPENGGSSSKLCSDQTSALAVHLESRSYTKVSEICAYVWEHYGIHYTVAGMHSWLKREGFSFKKPAAVPGKADAVAQAAWVAAYERLMTQTPEDEPIVFADGVHPTMATKVSYGWIRVGKRKPIATTASRTRMNVMGSLNLETMQLHTTSHERLNADSMEEHFQLLREHYRHAPKIHVILDRGGYNISKKTKELAERYSLKLHYLPSYSPNLNPIERCWKIMNEMVRNNRFFTSAKEFREAIEHFFEVTWPSMAMTMRDRVNDCFQHISPASSF